MRSRPASRHAPRSCARRPGSCMPPLCSLFPRPSTSMIFEPQRTVFVVLSFEGPDAYSQAGGLGVRVKGLTRTLARLGFQTYLYFCGDPDLPGEESHESARLVY